jgi:hypothetical protein
MRAATGRLIRTAVAAMLGFMVGWLGSAVGHVMPKQANYPFLAEQVPLPHQVPQYPGGLSFRFAMAHDVIHERFAKHGPAHYRERDRLTREKLATLDPDDPAGFPLRDDLAAGLERLGKSAEAVDVMRDKLARQRKRGIAGRDLYTSFANLGTFLIHANLPKAMAGDAEARDRFREGIGLIRQSVEVNPEAHFGRERWQAAIAEFLLASMDDPTLLGKFDCLGNRLDAGIEALLDREGNWTMTGHGRPYDADFAQWDALDEVPEFFRPGISLDDQAIWPEVNKIRRHITKVGAEEGEAVPSHTTPVPFDEPMLGIIGMWRQGGGANPHFCLAIGETMLRVGQRYIAWAAFERAGRMADRFWPDEAIRQTLRDQCRKRQAQIEQTLTFHPAEISRQTPWQQVSPPPDPEAVANLRSEFDRELALGEGYQKAYQKYEEERIAAGVPITDEHFFDEFLAARDPIASPTGPEEWFVGVPRPKMDAYLATRRRAWGILGAGLAASGAALFRWMAAGRKKKPTPEDIVFPGIDPSASPGR